jgi:hypothetical protein
MAILTQWRWAETQRTTIFHRKELSRQRSSYIMWKYINVGIGVLESKIGRGEFWAEKPEYYY